MAAQLRDPAAAKFELPAETYEHVSALRIRQLPEETADAEEVRTFIYDFLTSNYGLDIPRSTEISKAWTVGTGGELRKYPARLFVKIFGDQVGWILYKEVHSRPAEAEIKKNAIFDPRKGR